MSTPDVLSGASEPRGERTQVQSTTEWQRVPGQVLNMVVMPQVQRKQPLKSTDPWGAKWSVFEA